MKKVLLIILLCIPTITNALEIKDTSLTGNETQHYNHYFSLTFKIDLQDIESIETNTKGIWLIAYKIDFDDNVLMLNDVTAQDFETIYFKSEDDYYALSEVKEFADTSCVYGLLYCKDYIATISLYANVETETTTSVSISEIELAYLDMTDETKEYTIDDAIILTANSTTFENIKITKPEVKEIPEDKPEEIFSLKHTLEPLQKPTKETKEESTTNVNKEQTQTKPKSSNAYLKSINIENYKIDFNKLDTEYTLTVEEGVNSLKITTKTENENATVKITGNDNLKENKHKVTINVTAEDGTTKNYIINVKEKYDISKYDTEKEEITPVNTNTSKTKNKITKYLIIGTIITVLLTIIIITHSILKKRSLNKFFTNTKS